MRLSAVCLLPLLLLSACATFKPESLHRVQAYDGPALPRDQVAVLYTSDNKPPAESTTMCEIDGVSLEHDGVCASVAYVLPGSHAVSLRYLSSNEPPGVADTVIVVKPGELYEMAFSWVGPNVPGLVTAIPWGPNVQIRWRDVAPGQTGRSWLDELVPYAANAPRAAPLPQPPLTPDERATADRLLACAADFATSVDVLIASRGNPVPANDQRFRFMATAHEYLPDEALQSGYDAARAHARNDYVAAFDLAPSASAAQAAAVERLEADLRTCDDFRRDHASEFSARHDKRLQH